MDYHWLFFSNTIKSGKRKVVGRRLTFLLSFSYSSKMRSERDFGLDGLENFSLSRIIKEIEIEGQPAFALFDTGATNTYAEKELLKTVSFLPVPEPYRVALGGRAIEVKEVCLLRGKIEGLGFDTKAIP